MILFPFGWAPMLGPFVPQLPSGDLAEWRPCAVAVSVRGEPRELRVYTWDETGRQVSEVRTTADGDRLDETTWTWTPEGATSVWHTCRFGPDCTEERHETRWILDASGRPIMRDDVDYEIVRVEVSEDGRTLTHVRSSTWNGRIVDRNVWTLDRRGRPTRGLRDDAGDSVVETLHGTVVIDARGKPVPGEVETSLWSPETMAGKIRKFWRVAEG